MDYYTIPMSLAGLPAALGSVRLDDARRRTPADADRLAALRPALRRARCCSARPTRTSRRRTTRKRTRRRSTRCPHERRVRGGDRHRVPRRAQDRDEDVLRLPELVRRRTEHEGVPGLSGHARCASGSQRAGDRGDRHGRTGVRRRDSEVFQVRPQELLLSGHAQGLSDLAVRHAADAGRQRALLARGRDAQSVPPHAHPFGRGHRESRRTRARATAASREARTRWSISTAPAFR